MFDSFKRKSNKVSNESEDKSREVLDDNLPKMELALNEIDKNVMSDVQKEYLKDELNELKSINKNDVDVSPVYFNYSNGVLEVKVFIRNAFVKPVDFDKIPFVISDEDGNVVARKIFDLREIGKLEPNTAKPCKLFFEDEYIIKKDFDNETLKIGFGINLKCFKDVETKITNFPEGLSQEECSKYESLLQGLNKFEENTVNMSAVELIKYSNGDIGISLIIRNGYDREISIDNIPITLYDNNNIVIASGVFKSMTFKVETLSASLYRLIFKADEITNNDYDITAWHVSFKC